MLNRKFNRYLLLTILSSLLFSCATAPSSEFVVSVDAISAHNQSDKKYLIVSGDKNLKESDLQFKEYKNFVDRALKYSGYQPVKSKKEAEIIIFLSYGISAPQKHLYTYSTAYTSEVGSYNTYTRVLVLSAMQNKEKTDEEIWKITAESTGNSNDLRFIFPILAAAIEPYIGKNSGTKIAMRIYEDDDVIKRIKGEFIPEKKPLGLSLGLGVLWE